MKLGLFSGGKDSLVACHVMQDELDGVLYCKTGIGLDENFNYVKDITQKLGWKLNILEPRKDQTYEMFVKKFGFPGFGIHSAIMGFLKYMPMRRFHRAHEQELESYISGVRRKESKRRMRTVKSKINIMERIKFEAVLFDWSTKDVWDYIKKHELELCPVYETMHMSGDCMCGSFSQSGEAELLATFHSYMAKRIEALEQKYGGRWGNQSSMTGALKQGKIDNYICQECLFNYRS